MVALCADVEVTGSVGWCSRGRGSHARDAMVDVESGVASVEVVVMELRPQGSVM